MLSSSFIVVVSRVAIFFIAQRARAFVLLNHLSFVCADHSPVAPFSLAHIFWYFPPFHTRGRPLSCSKRDGDAPMPRLCTTTIPTPTSTLQIKPRYQVNHAPIRSEIRMVTRGVSAESPTVASSTRPEAIAAPAPAPPAAPATPAVEAVDVLPLLHHLLDGPGIIDLGLSRLFNMHTSMVIDFFVSGACNMGWAARTYLDGAALEEGVVELHGVVHRGLLQELHVREPGRQGKMLS